MSKLIFIALIALTHVVYGNEKCPYENDLGKELVQRIYAAETFFHMDSPYTDDLKKLNYNKDGLQACDIKNWNIKINLKGKDAFLATLTNKITKKSYTVDEKKNVSEP